MIEHSPLPWTFTLGEHVADANGNTIAVLFGDRELENGRIIESAAEMYRLLLDYQTIAYADWSKRRFTLLKAIEGPEKEKPADTEDLYKLPP